MNRELLSRITHWEGLLLLTWNGCVKPADHDRHAADDEEADSLLAKRSLST